MNRLFRVLHRWKCTTLAQQLAVDALRHLDGDAERGAGLILWHIDPYLRGVAAPETQFRDFTNHVFYPIDNWGGAARLARKWYWRTVESLRTRDWNEATYNAGVLARYVTFAFMPLRTGHGEQSLAMRAPLEWSAARCYSAANVPDDASSSVTLPNGEDWLERLVMQGAEAAHCHLKECVDRFDFDAAVKNARALDQALLGVLNVLNARAAATVGAILTRAIVESGSKLPRYPLGPAGLFALPSLPLFWMSRARSRAAERTPIRVMHREWKTTGKIERTLPDSARAVSDAYELEVLKKAPRKIEALKHETQPPAALRSGSLAKKAVSSPPRPVSPSPTPRSLTTQSSLNALPSIDAKLITRLESVDVTTVGQLLEANAEDLAACLHPDATSADVAGWQDEARLCCEIRSLSPAEAQLLAACGVTGSADLAALSPVELWELVIPVAESPDGRRVLRGQPVPGLDAVTGWIDAAKKAA